MTQYTVDSRYRTKPRAMFLPVLSLLCLLLSPYSAVLRNQRRVQICIYLHINSQGFKYLGFPKFSKNEKTNELNLVVLT
jgi:hypothetical protein